MSDRLDMTGMWEGTYAYPGYRGPTTPFVANLLETEARLSGTILEPDARGHDASRELESTIVGMRDDQAVDFIKTYGPGRAGGFKVDYVGRLSDDGVLVTGVWSNGREDGTFEMRRERGWDEVIAAAQEEPLEAEKSVPQSTTSADPPSAGDA